MFNIENISCHLMFFSISVPINESMLNTECASKIFRLKHE